MRLALVWDNFGPLHDDRLRACVERLPPGVSVLGLEISGRSDVYAWTSSRSHDLPKVTLFPDEATSETSELRMAVAVLKVVLRQRIDAVFLCHYDRPGTALLAYVLRLLGRRVFLMGCAKFDDRPRSVLKEAAKRLVLAPYMGALVGGFGTRAYFEFLGLRSKPIVYGYNTVSNARIRELAAQAAAPARSFAERDFVVVARMVPKKNITAIIDAYARFLVQHPEARRQLHLCGDGSLEQQLRKQVAALGLDDRVIFHGFIQSDGVAGVLKDALALLLVSTEEQFGNVVPEALALRIPVILSDVCGARYELLRTGVNGFLVEADNVEGLAYYLGLLHDDAELWARLSAGAEAMASLGDTARFAEGVAGLSA